MKSHWFFSLALLGACNGGDAIVEGAPARAVVYGRVTTAEGAPVAGARVLVRGGFVPRAEDCRPGAAAGAGLFGGGLTDGRGAYGILLQSHRDVVACVAAHVVVPGADTVRGRAAPVWLLRPGMSVRPDSLRADVSLAGG